MNPTIRKATLKDLHAIQLLNALLFQNDAKWHPTLNRKWMYEEDGLNYFKWRIRSRTGLILVAEHEGAVVGYLAGGISKVPYRKEKLFAEIENMFVAKEARGLGIGKSLVEFFRIWCKSKKAKVIRVEAVFKNKEACGFYRSQGFEEYNIVMEKKV